MRSFHTYVDTPRGLSRGLADFEKSVLQGASLEQKIKATFEKTGQCSILEIGTGKGAVLLELNSKFPNLHSVGMNKEPSHGAAAKEDLQRTAEELHLTVQNVPQVVIGDATKLPFEDETFDIVISQVALVHVKDKLKALREVSRVLKVGGDAFLDLDSWQMKKHKEPGPLPEVYKKLYAALKAKATPRILLQHKRKWISLQSMFKSLKQNAFSLRIVTCPSKSDKYYSPCFSQFLYLHKKATGKLLFPYKRNTLLSNKVTNLPITDHNPASYGVVDVYELSE